MIIFDYQKVLLKYELNLKKKTILKIKLKITEKIEMVENMITYMKFIHEQVVQV